MKLSYSKILTYRSCPKKYKFKYIDHIPEPETPELSLGKTGHSILEAYYKEPSVFRNNDLLRTLCNNLGNDNKEKMLTIFLNPCPITGKTYHETWEEYDKELADIQVEKEFLQKFEFNWSYEGRIDLLAKYNNIGMALEHKFKGKWAPDFENTLQFDEQSRSYCLLAGINMVVFNCIRTIPAKTRPKYERFVVLMENHEKPRLIEDISLWRTRIQLDETTSTFPRNRGFMCQYCPYKDICLDRE